MNDNRSRPLQRDFSVMPCVQCKRRVRVPRALVGRPLTCPGCGGPLENVSDPVPSTAVKENAVEESDIIEGVEVVEDEAVIDAAAYRLQEPPPRFSAILHQREDRPRSQCASQPATGPGSAQG
jgi:hypothetical protein